MKFIFKFLLIALSFSTSFAAKSEVLQIGSYEHVIQFNILRELQQYVAEALQKENIQVKYLPAPVLRGGSLVQSGEIDGEMPSSKENLKYFSHIVFVKSPLLYTNLKVIHLSSDKNYAYENLPKLRGVMTLNNSTLRKVAKERNLKLLEVIHIEQAFEMLEKKRVDYLIISEDIAKNFLQDRPDREKLFTIDSPVVAQVPFYFGLSSRKSFLIPRIEKALTQASRADLQKYPLIKNLLNKQF